MEGVQVRTDFSVDLSTQEATLRPCTMKRAQSRASDSPPNSHLLPDLQSLYYFVPTSQLLIKLSPELQKDISVTHFFFVVPLYTNLNRTIS